MKNSIIEPHVPPKIHPNHLVQVALVGLLFGIKQTSLPYAFQMLCSVGFIGYSIVNHLKFLQGWHTAGRPSNSELSHFGISVMLSLVLLYFSF